MTAACPHCHGTGRIDADPVAELRAGCEQLGIPISWDSTVDEPGAARLLNRSPKTLANRRMTDRPLAFTRSGNRIRYALGEIARFIAEGRDIEE